MLFYHCTFEDGEQVPIDQLSHQHLIETVNGIFENEGNNGVTDESIKEQARIILLAREMGLL